MTTNLRRQNSDKRINSRISISSIALATQKTLHVVQQNEFMPSFFQKSGRGPRRLLTGLMYRKKM